MAQDDLAMSVIYRTMMAFLRLAGGLACGFGVCVSAVSAQSLEAGVPLTTAETLALLPDPERYRLVIMNEGLTPDAVQEIGAMIIDGIGEDHFFGAVAAHVPESSQQLVIRVRAKLHSLEAAERAALGDCDEERTSGASPCRIIGQIVPEEWDEETPKLSHDVMYALDQLAGDVDGPIFVARSRNTAAWAIWSGDDTRQPALDECNDVASATGAEPDCDIVVDDTR